MTLPKPYYQDNHGVLYHGDCLEIMKDIPDKSVDLVLTSPPYNLGNSHHTGSIKTQPYDDNLPEGKYQNHQILILNELFKKINDGGSVLYNHKNRIKNGIQISPYEWITKTRFIIKQELVWFNRSQNFDKIRFYPMTERIYWLTKSPKTSLTNNRNHHDLFRFEAEGTQGEHKRAFPLCMAECFIACFPSAIKVLDPFAGSGTTLRAAKDLGRKYIGIEISEKYCEIIAKRMGQEVLF